MNKIKFLSFIFVLGLFFTSCDKEETNGPEVTISSPIDNTSFAVTDAIPLTAIITDDIKISNINISSSLGLNENITAFDSDIKHTLAVTLTLDANTTAGSYDIIIKATDSDGNIDEESVTIKVQ